MTNKPIDKFADNVEQSIVPVTSLNNIDITPVFNEIIEYAKDQAVMGDLEATISSVPSKDSLDWKLISGVLMNSTVEWVVENKGDDSTNSMDLIRHLQKDVGYLLQRLGLAG
jgi:hypothetical protein|tara:strand:- start:272 stop:607 length:336 start_codon:yes stop_codon:yes gene_type:complete